MSRRALYEERLSDAREHIGDADVEAAFIAARFLCQRRATEREGLAGLRALLERPNLPAGADDSIRELMEATTHKRREAPPRRSRPLAQM